jgi:hypothetical protein
MWTIRTIRDPTRHAPPPRRHVGAPGSPHAVPRRAGPHQRAQ